MLKQVLLLVLTAACAGCGPSKLDQCKSKVAALEATKRQEAADLFRKRAECKAQDIEFGGTAVHDRSCYVNLEAEEAMYRQTIQAINARYAAPDMRECQALLDTQKPQEPRGLLQESGIAPPSKATASAPGRLLSDEEFFGTKPPQN